MLAGAGLMTIAHDGIASTSRAEITIKNFAFTPPAISVCAGAVVIFKNEDPETHSVVATNGSFNSQAFEPGQTFAITLKWVGKVTYFCAGHQFMEGRIVVAP